MPRTRQIRLGYRFRVLVGSVKAHHILLLKAVIAQCSGCNHGKMVASIFLPTPHKTGERVVLFLFHNTRIINEGIFFYRGTTRSM